MKNPMPYDFLLDHLPATVVIKPAIGMFYVYFKGKIVLIFRKVGKNPQHNGIWISTAKQFHNSLKTEIPAISDFDFGEGENFDTTWLLLKDGLDDFEEASIALCALICSQDNRIGKATPKAAELTGNS